MAIFRLEVSQVVNAPVGRCWEFFSSPANLSKITPPDLAFEVRGTVPEAMYPGLMIEYRVRPLLGIPLAWLTEITHVEAPHYFVDEQRRGPYAIWHHEHFFEPAGTGATTMRDRVTYSLPCSPLGDWMHPFLVRPRIEQIFRFRRHAVDTLFPGNSLSPQAG